MLAKPCLHSIKQQGKKGDTVSMHKYDNNAGDIIQLIGQRFNVSGYLLGKSFHLNKVSWIKSRKRWRNSSRNRLMICSKY
jgi:hypothetical protein